MPTTNGNRRLLDLKRWEMVAPSPVTTGAGVNIVSLNDAGQNQFLFASATLAYMYEPFEDGWIQLPSPGMAGTFGAGSTGAGHAYSTGNVIAASSITAVGGTASSIFTTLPLARDLRGYKVHIMGGPNAGATLDITSNTMGVSSVINVTPQASAFTAATIFRLITPRAYLINGGTLAAGAFRCTTMLLTTTTL